MHPALALTLGLAGAAAVVRWCYREVRRVNAELDAVRASGRVDAGDRKVPRKLKPDPVTGEYRPD
jgi:hypothetical protein